MPTFTPPHDQGIVFYATQDGSGSFTLTNGTAGTVRTLANANYVSGDWINCSLIQDLHLTVSGVISAGMASAVIALEGRRVDVNNGSLFGNPQVLGTVRGDSPSTAAAASQTVTRANLAGQSVANGTGGGAATETLDVALITTDARWCDQFRVIVKATNAAEAGDKIIVAAQGK